MRSSACRESPGVHSGAGQLARRTTRLSGAETSYSHRTDWSVDERAAASTRALNADLSALPQTTECSAPPSVKRTSSRVVALIAGAAAAALEFAP